MTVEFVLGGTPGMSDCICVVWASWVAGESNCDGVIQRDRFAAELLEPAPVQRLVRMPIPGGP